MTAIETGCPYSISVVGRIASFNVPTDANFCGYLTDVTGLDMYGVRENAQTNAAGDGGYHGPFWRDRRPFTLTGFAMPVFPLLSRDQAQDKIGGVLGECLRQDGVLNWTPADGIQRGIYFRTQQPLRLTPGQSLAQKTFLVACVARDWRVLKWAQSNAGNSGAGLPILTSETNNGNADAAPIFTVTGPINQPITTNNTSLKKFTFTGNVPAAQQLVIDLTGVYPSILLNGADASNLVDPLNTDYTIAVLGGGAAQNIQLSSGSGSPGTTGATGLSVGWHDSWH
jgi:hypothetical protein